MRPSGVVDPNIARLYRATFLFGIACGVSIALSSLHLDAIGYDKEHIGTLAAWFASGVVGMSIPTGALIRRFSARSVLLFFLVGYAFSVGAFPFIHSYYGIAAIRAIDGACSVAIWVSSETILLSRADKTHKAYLTSLYAIWLSCGYVVGPILAKGVAAFFPMSAAFVVAGVVSMLAMIYVRTTFADDGLGMERRGPPGQHQEHTEEASDEPPASSWSILKRIKTSLFGAFAYGYFQAATVIFLPLYLMESKGIPRERTIVLPALFCFGMLVSSNAVGRLADRIGHLLVMRVLAIVGTGMVLGFIFLDSYALMCVAVTIAGATLAAMSPVSLALQGVVTEKKDYSRSNAIYNAFYASGILFGPWVSSILFARHGGKTMLFHLVGLWTAFVVFSVIYMFDDPAARRGRASAEPAEVPAVD